MESFQRSDSSRRPDPWVGLLIVGFVILVIIFLAAYPATTSTLRSDRVVTRDTRLLTSPAPAGAAIMALPAGTRVTIVHEDYRDWPFVGVRASDGKDSYGYVSASVLAFPRR